MDPQAIVLASLRAGHLLALASLFGTLTSLALVAPAEAGAARARLVRLAQWSAGLALLIGAAWLVLQALTMTGAASVSGALTALRTVLRDTRFGHLMILRFGLLLALFSLLSRHGLAMGGLDSRGWPITAALVLAGLALAIQGGAGHAGAAGGPTGAGLLLLEALHLLGAAAWLGGLLPLFVLVGSLPRPAAFTACRSFSALGLGAVLLIAGTALVQSWQWIGSLGGLFGTQYGRIALLKLGLFAGLLSLAAVNHFVLTDRLQPGANAIARRLLRRSIVAEVLLGALVILAAAFLASAAPATHEAPVWPFSWRPSLDVLSDANGRRQLWGSLLPVGIAGACVIIGLLWRPVFWVSLTVLGILLGLTSPRLASLLTTDAYPTTFARSPTEFADSSIVRGAALFAVHCSLCHGTDARGDGPIAQSLPVRPADLTAAHLWAHTEGDLFWYVSHGITAPSGASAMPAFADKLPSDDRWALIDFLKAHNAGQTVQGGGQWSRPVPLPQFDARCGDGSTIDLDDLRGRVVHIIAPGPENVPPPATATGDPKVATIVLSRQRPVKPTGAACATIERDAWTAFSIVLGVTPEALPETQALADQNGWLRARWRPGDPADWNDPTVLAAAIRDIVAHPLAVAASGGHIH